MKRRRARSHAAVAAALVALGCGVGAQTINAPDSIVACTSATITWTGGTAPFDVSVRNKDDHVLLAFRGLGGSGDPIVGRQDWIVRWLARTR